MTCSALLMPVENNLQPDVFVVLEVISFKKTDYNRSKNK